MKKTNNILTLKNLFENEKEFMDALDDALLLENLKTPSKFSIEIEDLEEQIINLISPNKKFALKILLANYKRFLYKHILELEKLKK